MYLYHRSESLLPNSALCLISSEGLLYIAPSIANTEQPSGQKEVEHPFAFLQYTGMLFLKNVSLLKATPEILDKCFSFYCGFFLNIQSVLYLYIQLLSWFQWIFQIMMEAKNFS